MMQVSERRAGGITVQLIAVIVGLALNIGAVVWSAATVTANLQNFRETQSLQNNAVNLKLDQFNATMYGMNERLTRVETRQSK